MTNTRESRHTETSKFYQSLSAQRDSIYTTDFVLSETITLLYRKLPTPTAQTALQVLNNSVAQSRVVLERITSQRFEAAIQLRLKYDDKPDISFTDLTSFVVMRELDIQQVITGDEHFEHVGMGFVRIP
jgi:predicted nucleic acid-binding protein